MKKGLFFSIDSLLAAGIIFSVIIFASSVYVKEQPKFELDYHSQDILEILSNIKVEESDNQYVEELLTAGTIKNSSDTLLEQIVELWVNGDSINANKITSNITDPFISKTHGFGLWINNEVIYTREIAITKSLVSYKKIVSGIAKGQSTGLTRESPPELLGPVIVEVRVWK
jgi:hypothetical protein